MLRQSLHLSVKHEDGFWFHESEPLGLYAHGATVQESLENLSLQFDAAWLYYAKEDDAKLTADAQELEEALLEMVESVHE